MYSIKNLLFNSIWSSCTHTHTYILLFKLLKNIWVSKSCNKCKTMLSTFLAVTSGVQSELQWIHKNQRALKQSCWPIPGQACLNPSLLRIDLSNPMLKRAKLFDSVITRGCPFYSSLIIPPKMSSLSLVHIVSGSNLF